MARLGGDEFGILLPEPSGAEAVLSVIQRIRAALAEPICLHDLPLLVEASIGIALFPDDGDTGELLVKRADAAMYSAKREGTTYAFYDRSAGDHDPKNLTLLAELRRAMDQRELTLFYQPKAVLEGGQVSSVEALVRWQHPHRGLIYPDAFIPAAQDTALIGPLTLYVIDEALRQTRAWHDEGLELSVSVNVAMRNLLDVEFPREVAQLLERRQVDAELLELEIAESALLANPSRTEAVLEELAELGVRLSIDDFGTAYSSFGYMRRAPISEIKIDRSFVMGMNEASEDMAVVRSAIDLGRNLGIKVVAEGVETQEAWDRLRELGCAEAQGYYLSRPVPPQQLSQWLGERSAGRGEAA